MASGFLPFKSTKMMASCVGFFGSPKMMMMMMTMSVSSSFSSKKNILHLQKRCCSLKVNCKMIYNENWERDMSTMKKKMQVEDIASSLGYNDSEEKIRNVVAEAFSKVGREGAVVTLKGGKHDSLYLVEGMQFSSDSLYPYFDTKREEEIFFDNENCKLLLVDKIGNAKDLASVLKDAINGGYPILIIAWDIQREALDAFVASRPVGAPNIMVLVAPAFFGHYVDDIALLTGATVIRGKVGLTLENVESEVLGFAAKVVVAKGGTTIVSDGSTKESLNREAEKIKELVLAKKTALKIPAESIKEIFQEARLIRQIERLNKRLVSLSERVAVIEVGAETEEAEEKKRRFDVALNKIKMAFKKGIVAGGEVDGFKENVTVEKVLSSRVYGYKVTTTVRVPFGVVNPTMAEVLNDLVESEQLMRLSERVAVIEVGVESEKEAEEEKQRLDAALNKIKMAFKEDIVAGGEVDGFKENVPFQKVIYSDDPYYGYKVTTKMYEPFGVVNPTMGLDVLLKEPRCIIKIVTSHLINLVDIIVERSFNKIHNVDDLLSELDMFTYNLIRSDDITAERLLNSINSVDDLLAKIDALEEA